MCLNKDIREVLGTWGGQKATEWLYVCMTFWRLHGIDYFLLSFGFLFWVYLFYITLVCFSWSGCVFARGILSLFLRAFSSGDEI